MSIDVSEEVIEALASGIETLRANAVQWGSVSSTLRELRRQLSEKEAEVAELRALSAEEAVFAKRAAEIRDELRAEVQRAVLAGVKGGLMAAQQEAADYGRNVPMARMYADRIANFIRDADAEAIAAKVKL